MNNQTLVNANSKLNVSSREDSLIRLLVFSIDKLTLALPVHRVRKVTKYSPLYGSGLSHVNLTHFGNQELTVIDLHQKLFNCSQDDLNPDGGYFIVVKSDQTPNSDLEDEYLGIRAIDAPILMDVSFKHLRSLPKSYRYADTLEIASHVAIIPGDDNSSSQTIFVLDLDCLI